MWTCFCADVCFQISGLPVCNSPAASCLEDFFLLLSPWGQLGVPSITAEGTFLECRCVPYAGANLFAEASAALGWAEIVPCVRWGN